MAFSSNQADNSISAVDIQSSSGNLINNYNQNIDLDGYSSAVNNDFAVDSTYGVEVENFIEGFDDSFSNTSGLWIPKVDDDVVKPYYGQSFSDIESCFNLYAKYASEGGFDVCKSSQKIKNGIVVSKFIICSKGGKHELAMSKDLNCSSESSLVSSTVGVDDKKRRRTVTKKCDCKAKIHLKYVGLDKYVISSFVEGHNHPLASESGKQFLRANRSITALQRRFLLDAAKTNIGANRAHSFYKSISGSYSSVGATAKDFQNWMRDIKLYIGKHDADMLLQKFKDKQETSDGGFFYEYETDSNGHLTGLFWADLQGRRSYEIFGDVVSFDATYRTNKYGMVFVPFIGVDNHWRSVTFASALLNHEDSTNFTWACEMFLKVFIRPPKCIITDQCLAMKSAINKTFPKTPHRYCMWHIMQKFTSKVGPLFCAESGFMEKLNKFVWSSHLTVAEFEEGWLAVLKEFGLTEHIWLKEIYDIRKSWIPAFFREEPMGALLRTTSRSESSNFFFNHFVQKGDTLSEFYICYESAIEKQIYENKKVNDGDRFFPKSVTEKQIEKYAACFYTRALFYKVQKQIKASCFHISLAAQPVVVDGITKYTVRDKTFDEKMFEVEYSFSTNGVHCSCKLFTRVGYLCRHCFYILGLWGVERIPSQFLCNRWMKNAEERFCKLKLSDITETSTGRTKKEMSNKIWNVFQGCVEYVSNNIDGLDFLFNEMNGVKLRLDEKFNSSRVTKDDMLEECFGVRPSGSTTVHPPLQSNNKGSRKRMVGPAEKSSDGKKRSLRKCNCCGLLGYHDARTCKQRISNMKVQYGVNQSNVMNVESNIVLKEGSETEMANIIS